VGVRDLLGSDDHRPPAGLLPEPDQIGMARDRVSSDVDQGMLAEAGVEDGPR
jgi:hypothetical protein